MTTRVCSPRARTTIDSSGISNSYSATLSLIQQVFLFSLLASIPTIIDTAPLTEDDLSSSRQTQLAEYDGSGTDSTSCYYNFQHYNEGDRIITNEPCLNCTCHKRMLMCYLRVCPFTKAVGQDCTVEKRPDQCCPVITCPEVPVQLLTSSTTSTELTPTETTTAQGTGLAQPSTFGCLVENAFYPDGAQVPSNPKNPCELCYCIRNRTACILQECTLNVDGCKPIHQHGVCCPVRYDCNYEELQISSEPSLTSGLVFPTTTQSPQQCSYHGEMFNDGELISLMQSEGKSCERCYCMRGEIVCAVQDCGNPLEGKDCEPIAPPQGQCCPNTYLCANETIPIDSLLDVTTAEPSRNDLPQIPNKSVADDDEVKPSETMPVQTELPQVPTVQDSQSDPITTDEQEAADTKPSGTQIVPDDVTQVTSIAETHTEISISTKQGEPATEPPVKVNNVEEGEETQRPEVDITTQNIVQFDKENEKVTDKVSDESTDKSRPDVVTEIDVVKPFPIEIDGEDSVDEDSPKPSEHFPISVESDEIHHDDIDNEADSPVILHHVEQHPTESVLQSLNSVTDAPTVKPPVNSDTSTNDISSDVAEHDGEDNGGIVSSEQSSIVDHHVTTTIEHHTSTSQSPSDDEHTTTQPSSEHHATIQPLGEHHTTIQPSSEHHATIQPLSEDHTTIEQLNEHHVTIQPMSDVHETIQPLSDVHETIQPLSDVHETIQPLSNHYTTIQPLSEHQATIQPQDSEHPSDSFDASTITPDVETENPKVDIEKPHEPVHSESAHTEEPVPTESAHDLEEHVAYDSTTVQMPELLTEQPVDIEEKPSNPPDQPISLPPLFNPSLHQIPTNIEHDHPETVDIKTPEEVLAVTEKQDVETKGEQNEMKPQEIDLNPDVTTAEGTPIEGPTTIPTEVKVEESAHSNENVHATEGEILAETTPRNEVVSENDATPEIISDKGITTESVIENEISQDQKHQTEHPPKQEMPAVPEEEEELPAPVTEAVIPEKAVIPGEGFCLVNGQSYADGEIVPATDVCQIACKCRSSIVECETISCPPPPPNLKNCVPITHGDNTCCVTYSCDGEKEKTTLEIHNQLGQVDEHVSNVKVDETPIKDVNDKGSAEDTIQITTTSPVVINNEPEGTKAPVPAAESETQSNDHIEETVTEHKNIEIRPGVISPQRPGVEHDSLPDDELPVTQNIMETDHKDVLVEEPTTVKPIIQIKEETSIEQDDKDSNDVVANNNDVNTEDTLIVNTEAVHVDIATTASPAVDSSDESTTQTVHEIKNEDKSSEETNSSEENPKDNESPEDLGVLETTTTLNVESHSTSISPSKFEEYDITRVTTTIPEVNHGEDESVPPTTLPNLVNMPSVEQTTSIPETLHDHTTHIDEDLNTDSHETTILPISEIDSDKQATETSGNEATVHPSDTASNVPILAPVVPGELSEVEHDEGTHISHSSIETTTHAQETQTESLQGNEEPIEITTAAVEGTTSKLSEHSSSEEPYLQETSDENMHPIEDDVKEHEADGEQEVEVTTIEYQQPEHVQVETTTVIASEYQDEITTQPTEVESNDVQDHTTAVYEHHDTSSETNNVHEDNEDAGIKQETLPQTHVEHDDVHVNQVATHQEDLKPSVSENTIHGVTEAALESTATESHDEVSDDKKHHIESNEMHLTPPVVSEQVPVNENIEPEHGEDDGKPDETVVVSSSTTHIEEPITTKLTPQPTTQSPQTSPDIEPSQFPFASTPDWTPKPFRPDPTTEAPHGLEEEQQQPYRPNAGEGGDYEEEEEENAFGPGTCRYGGKVFVSAQQVPRDNPCDFCFCFRSDIICLQQSCPPPIHGCRQESIQGFCCPRYECPVSMANALNSTTTTTTTTTLPPHFFSHSAYRGSARRTGCQVQGHAYRVGEEITSASGPCLHCICGANGQMKCDPTVCSPEPMLRKMIEAAVHRR